MRVDVEVWVKVEVEVLPVPAPLDLVFAKNVDLHRLQLSECVIFV
jgi:hypothetical protein